VDELLVVMNILIQSADQIYFGSLNCGNNCVSIPIMLLILTPQNRHDR